MNNAKKFKLLSQLDENESVIYNPMDGSYNKEARFLGLLPRKTGELVVVVEVDTPYTHVRWGFLEQIEFFKENERR